MTIIFHDDWELSNKGRKDAQRHREKIDDAIRRNARDVIGEESIITKKGKKIVKIPVRGLKDYRFVHGNAKKGGGGGAGAGQGDGKAGDTIAQRPKQGKKGSGDRAGNQKGVDYMETEVEIDYLLKIMFEDLGLPWIEEKTKAKQLVPKGWKFKAISKTGIPPRLHKKRTMIETIKRNIVLVAAIMEDTGCDEETAYRALNMAFGDFNEAVLIIEENRVDPDFSTDLMITDDDTRFKKIEQAVEYHSNAVVIAMMDVSGSMYREKKYLCRSLLFWMTEFLKKSYEHVQIRFIQHTTEAQIVSEDDFFNKGESGGTKCYTAFEMANHMIDTEYPIDEWNVYCVYCGDGEDWDTAPTIKHIQAMLDKKVNMLSYVEILLNGEYGYDGSLLNAIRKNWTFKTTRIKRTDFFKNEENRFLCSVIKSKEHIWPALKHMLFSKGKKQ